MEPFSMLAAILSIAGSVFSISKDLGVPVGEAIRKSISGYLRDNPDISAEEKLFLESDEAADDISEILTIENDLLQIYLDLVAKCEAIHHEKLKEAKTEQELDLADRKREFCSCDILRRIKRFNQNQLPGTTLERLWLSMQCAE